MNSEISFKPAKLSDAKLLLECRNDKLTRKASFHTDIISDAQHNRWLTRVLKDDTINLYLVYFKDDFIGTIRSNSLNNNIDELSWSLMPHARAKGLAKDMLYLFTLNLNTILYAYIKKDNIPSRKVAEFIGMQLKNEKDDVLLYEKVRL